MLVFGMGARAVNSQAIQHGNAKGCDEISVRPSADGSLAHVKSDFQREAPGVLKEHLDSRRAHQRRTVYSATHFDARPLEDRAKLRERLSNSDSFIFGLKAHIDPGTRLGGDNI